MQEKGEEWRRRQELLSIVEELLKEEGRYWVYATVALPPSLYRALTRYMFDKGIRRRSKALRELVRFALAAQGYDVDAAPESSQL